MAQFMKWSKDYETGNYNIDAEHKGLFTLVNDLHDKIEQGFGEKSIETTITALEDYAHYHFEREEALMDQCGFDGMGKHIALHRKFSKYMEHCRKSFEDDPSKFDIADFMGFLSNWLSGHILGEDMQYVDALKKSAKPKS
ncbi:MAG: hemerythrin family protein [Rhodospirillales bacterium]|nr:hemerythrin family protein [Rhodospirillales bacterium]